MAAVGDIVPPRDRGRYQGVLGSAFGVSTVVGPLLGGVFRRQPVVALDLLRQPPAGAGRAGVIAAVFHARAERTHHVVDYLGAATLAGSLSAIVLFTSLGGPRFRGPPRRCW
jgi:MFS family permease